MAKVENKIKDLLKKDFSPEFLEIINESDKHKGHAGDNSTGESHFKIVMVSSKFKGKNRVEMQRLVYKTLSILLKNDIHALSLLLKSSK